MKLLNTFSTLMKSIFALGIIGSLLMFSGCGSSGGGSTTYTIGGSVSGLSGSMVLQNNGGDDLTVSQTGDFTFETKLTDGADYSVSILTQPGHATCTVSNGSGSVSAAAVSNISVTCIGNPQGYYENGTSTALSLNDLQAIIHNDRIMMMSTSAYVLYDGTLTFTGNSFTGTVKVYFEGDPNGTGTISGTLLGGSSISGNITGTSGGAYDGDFSVTFAQANDTDTSSNAKTTATWRLSDAIVDTLDMVISAGNFTSFVSTPNGNNTEDCVPSAASITPVPSTNLYAVSMTLTTCSIPSMNAAGWTGFATTKSTSGTDDTLVLMFSITDHAIFGDLAKQ